MMKRAEAAGFGYGWTFDSHVLWQETFVLYPRILAETSSMVIGPMVTNPGTRDWSVIASMFATLNDTYGNRTICGIGRGDSARRYIGQAPVTLATLSSAMSVIKGLAEGREAIPHGQPLRIPWVSGGASLPVWMAAYGPKALRLVGEQADGFILQTADPNIARWRFRSGRGEARAVGLGPGGGRRGRARPGVDHDVRRRPGLRRDRPGASAGAAAVVRRHGRQPRRRPGRAVRGRRAGAARADRVHRRAAGLRLLPSRAGREPVDGLRPGRDRGPVLPPRPGVGARGAPARAGVDRRRPVRAVPDARRRGGHPGRLRGRGHPGAGRGRTTVGASGRG